MKKILISLVLLSGCTYNYSKIASDAINKTTKVEVETTFQNKKLLIQGSGAVISANGHILTCNHLFQFGSSTVTVKLNGYDKNFSGKVLLLDERKDLALIKIEARTPSHFKLAPHGTVKIGEEVMAIGHPLDMDWSVTKGIVSQKRIPTLYYTSQLQTDAAINKGNSGGPLINMNGELIGINVSRKTPSIFSVSLGLGFATSIEAIHDFLNDIRGL